MTTAQRFVRCEYKHEGSPSVGHSVDCGDSWTCRCGNQPWRDGFYPCDVSGTEVEPTEADWTSGLVTCSGCGFQIVGATGEIIGDAPTAKWTADVAEWAARPKCPGGHSGACPR